MVLLAALALAFRLAGMSASARDGAIRFDDPDTLRRLVRLRHLVEPGTPYPYRDPADGWYADPARRGTVLHWTLPMDGVILALDPLFAPFHPEARRFEAGAAWSAPVLGTLAVGAYFLLGRLWLGGGEIVLATLLYAVSYDPIANTAFGSGDHPSLQHLCVVVALIGFLALLAGRGGRGVAVLAGGALGLGLWITAETTVVLHAMALAAPASLFVGTPAMRPTLARRHREWALAALVVGALGDRLEHPGAGWTFEWDTISGFQLHQLLVFLLFAVVAGRTTRRPWLAPAVALAIGVLPFVASSGYRHALGTQLALAGAANRWTQSEITEYGRLFSVEGFFVPNQSWERFTWLVLALPILLVAVARDDGRPRALRAGVVVVAAALFGLTCYEVKLGHLFAVVYPVVIVLGGGALLGSLAPPVPAVAAAGAVILFLLPRHPVVGTPLFAAFGRPVDDPRWDDGNPGNALVRELRALPAFADGRRAVLADWSLGAFILYATDLPVVASGYHRNLAGIRDAYRVFVARLPGEEAALAALLRERGVRWIVTRYDPQLFVRGSRSFPELGEFGRNVRVEYRGHGLYDATPLFPPDTRRTFLWRAHLGGRLAEPTRVADQLITLYAEVPRGSFARGAMPNFIIYGVEDAG